MLNVKCLIIRHDMSEQSITHYTFKITHLLKKVNG